MRTRALRMAAVPAALALLLAGCLDTHTVVKLNRDGSGTVEESFLISLSFLETLKGMDLSFGGADANGGDALPADGGDGGQVYDGKEAVDAGNAPAEEAGIGGAEPMPDLASPPSEEQLQEMARRMGPGVQPLSVEPLRGEQSSGYRVVFRFDDINQLKLSQNPSAGMPGSPAGGAPPAVEEEEPFTFRFAPGSPAVLQILSPSPRPTSAGDAAAPPAESMGQEDQAAMMDMMREIYRDMRIRIAVQVPGTIVSTNASYRDGARVTLLDLDFARLLEDEARFRRLVQANPESMQDVKGLLADVPGLMVETKDRVEVRFR